jgi:hypothetical protein
LHGVLWQAGGREGRGIFKLSTISFKLDPVLLILGIAGIVFTTVIKRDWFPFLWLTPFLIFHFFISFIQHFHSITILPVICIAAAVMMTDLLDRINNKNKNMIGQTILPYAIISAIAIFGLVSTTMLITTNVNSFYFQLYASIVQYLPEYNKDGNDNDDNDGNNARVTVIGRDWVGGLSWIPKYVFEKDHYFINMLTPYKLLTTKEVLLVVDNRMKDSLKTKKVPLVVDNDINHDIYKHKKIPLRTFYNNSTVIAILSDTTDATRYSSDNYPYTSMRSMRENSGIVKKIEIRANY